ncbi:MAG: hypothetical protein DME33_15845 [Verrucomicrobia bacterium]|nr:MAG: hypothetical protein DME33_15845 [Verrucomicrobiota bacterium]
MELDKLSALIPILLFLLPGLVTAGVVNALVVRKPKDAFDKVIEALIFTMFNLTLFVIVRWLLELIPKIQFARDNFYTVGNISLMTACSITVALVTAAEMNNEWLLQKLRDWRITRKTAKPSTWIETLAQSQRFVVHLTDGRRVYGWPTFYSDTPEERAIYLESASWLGDDNAALNDPLISILLDKESGIKLIEFVEN